jgi:hypothetical protein
MTRRRSHLMRGIGLARLLLLLTVAVGVMSMHALGHLAGGDPGGMSAMGASPAAVHATGSAGAHRVAPPAPGRGPARHRMPRTDPMSACLGILAAGLLAACAMTVYRLVPPGARVPGGRPGGRLPCCPCFAGPLVLRI